jgi:hypothetical protein
MKACGPGRYEVWINILRCFAAVLPRNCPHPSSSVESGLGQQGSCERSGRGEGTVLLCEHPYLAQG